MLVRFTIEQNNYANLQPVEWLKIDFFGNRNVREFDKRLLTLIFIVM